MMPVSFVLFFLFGHCKHRNKFHVLNNNAGNTEPLHFTHCVMRKMDLNPTSVSLQETHVVLQCVYFVLYSVCKLVVMINLIKFVKII